MKTSTNFYLFNLAMADLIIILMGKLLLPTKLSASTGTLGDYTFL